MFELGRHSFERYQSRARIVASVIVDEMYKPEIQRLGRASKIDQIHKMIMGNPTVLRFEINEAAELDFRTHIDGHREYRRVSSLKVNDEMRRILNKAAQLAEGPDGEPTELSEDIRSIKFDNPITLE